jgi:hypothetical protein
MVVPEGVKCRLNLGGRSMRELANEIALLELRSEQLLIYLKQAGQAAREAAAARSHLLRVLERLALLKGKRDGLLDECRMAA